MREPVQTEPTTSAPPLSAPSIVQQIAAYIDATQGQRSPEPAREAALKCIFDLLAAAAVGTEDIGPQAIRQTAPQVFGSGTVPLWFTGQTSSVIGAAWANASASAALDLDDGNRYARGHPGAAVIPTAFAVGHEVDATQEEILTAIVIGYEVGVAVGTARTTYGSSGTWTPYGVVATAAALRRTPRHMVEHALAIAGESAPNQSFAGGPAPRIPAPEGAAVKEGIPWSVVTGLTALYLAEAGHTGPRNILDSVRHYQFPTNLALGRNAHICQTYFKPYACCRHIHAPLAALLHLIDEHQIDVQTIERIEVDIHAAGLRISNRPSPDNLIDVQYSIPYCLALAALSGPQALVPVTQDALDHEDVTALAHKVVLALDTDLDAVYPGEILARVSITCGARRFTSEPTPPAGEPLMSWEELKAKFRMATRLVATAAQQQQLIDALHATESGSMETLVACLAGMNLGVLNRAV
ncbi:MmgE/PrpD family protein [Pigmentiphaga aceris]|uniref:MmgE/PrpD family protein n=2 Tax=Pigmentiphaga aceris TaxID=1940612 RepID=A0A5C0B845_9BURK|nr:MmgE/PrpD family protein [Pigmentiphaga aceris]